ncbi:hypothetical protein [Saccharopolyspora phatthalungensis]|uniref:Uncharacterized protein n=1 Tax=Saccharopolyspora phatthalungensis TaxID=664693 RepID=A0A840QCL0_9PSEU|nr:hypothetical protein [Saccharopolyspora phatthalungensis]MBB5158126.1 hypothetical protein [Saccharopolyspora phatthalungensis]
MRSGVFNGTESSVMAGEAINMTGIPDPGDPGRWLVRPWPANASFCEVVRHFLNAYVWRLLQDTDVRRQLDYFSGYRAALENAPTYELTCAADWQWREELLAVVGRCVDLFEAQRCGERKVNLDHLRLPEQTALTLAPG